MMSFSKQAEEKLLHAVKTVASYAETGEMSPTDAVVKAASELNVPPEYVSLMAQAYNQGRATLQRTQSPDDVLCKLAEFPLASAQEAMAKLYPAAPPSVLHKEAVADDYSRPPHKAAELKPNFAATVKLASIFDYAAGSGLGRGLEEGVAKSLSPKPPSELLQDTLIDLEDPVHVNKLRQIEAQSMLTDLLRNDEVISGYQPAEVLEAYNEISAISPRAATQPAIMRPLLRKRLTAGAVEPFEGEQLLNMEKNLRLTTEPQRGMGFNDAGSNGSSVGGR